MEWSARVCACGGVFVCVCKEVLKDKGRGIRTGNCVLWPPQDVKDDTEIVCVVHALWMSERARRQQECSYPSINYISPVCLYVCALQQARLIHKRRQTDFF